MAFAMLTSILIAVLLNVPADLSRLTVPVAQAAEIGTSTVQQYAYETALYYGLDVHRFMSVINCESRWNWNAVGDHGTSIGLVQLRFPPEYWGVSTSTALDPLASIDIMARAWAHGQANKWSCYKLTE